jgi:GT2 family glycosyltransferase
MSDRDQRLNTELNFLDASHACAGVERSGSTLAVVQPWAIAKFGRVSLRPGWWRFECDGESDTPEVRLSSDRDPLIVIRAGASSERVYLADTGAYEVNLLVSPWPGSYRFSSLRLIRLTEFETGRLMLAAASRLSRRKDPLKLLLRASRQLMSGRALGLATPTVLAVEPPPEIETRKATAAANPKRVAVGSAMLRAREGDRLHAQAQKIVEEQFALNPALMAVYADAVEGGKLMPFPAWDHQLAESGAFDNAPLFLRQGVQAQSVREVVSKWGERGVARIPLPLIEREALAHDLLKVGAAPELSRLPTVSVVIPTKYRMDLLEKCLTGLRERTGYSPLEVIIIDNGVSDERFAGLVKAASVSFSTRVVEDKGPFNFSRLVNAGVRVADGEIILLLNDDIEPLSAGWLHRMVASASAPDVGAVGARLYYPDRTIQHAGVVLGLGGTCAHLWRGMSEANALRNPYIVHPGTRMAVTGACLAVKRSEYNAIRGFDEAAFPVAYNDIDFCLRLHEQGLRNVYRGDAELVHHESQSRGYDDASIAARKRQAAEAAKFLQRWRQLTQSDPYFSPAFDPSVELGVAHRANYQPADLYHPI